MHMQFVHDPVYKSKYVDLLHFRQCTLGKGHIMSELLQQPANLLREVVVQV